MQLGRQLEQQEALRVLSQMPELTTMQRQLLKVAPGEVVKSMLTPTEVEKQARILSDEEVKKRFPKLPAGTIVQQKTSGEFTFKEPAAGIVKERAKLKNTVDLLDEIEKDYKSLNKPVGGIFGVGFDPDRLSGQIGRFTGSKKGKQYSKFIANINKTTTFLTQAISGAAVSEAEAERIKKLIPQVTDTEATFEAKLESLRSYLNDARKNYGDDIVKAIENINPEKYEPEEKFDFKIGTDGIYDVTGG
jgi:predicted ribosome quality control (RQC) complex YloA/Tae2 family protein